ncbi:MAG: hypothetical protein JJE07_12320 [Flavobacteriaceae bacterium]|nr:hypothetical protein [Flavobacteriaceae bacterium]
MNNSLKNISDIIIATFVIISFIAFFVWAFYYDMQFWTQNEIYLFYTAMAFMAYVFMVVNGTLIDINKDSKKKSTSDIFTLNNKIPLDLISIIAILFLGIPILGIVLFILIFLGNNLYYLLMLYLLSTLIVFLKSQKNYVYYFIGIGLFVAMIYLGFQARNILEIRFLVIYDNREYFGH